LFAYPTFCCQIVFDSKEKYLEIARALPFLELAFKKIIEIKFSSLNE
jgi:hypothetical protein